MPPLIALDVPEQWFRLNEQCVNVRRVREISAAVWMITLSISKPHMKNLLLASTLLLLLSCHKQTTGDDRSILSGSWTMVKVSDQLLPRTFTRPPAVKDVLVQFTGDANGGQVSGFTPSNTIRPSAYTLGEEHALSIPELDHTKVGEPQWGYLFLDHIRTSKSYQINNDELLILTERYILAFKRS